MTTVQNSSWNTPMLQRLPQPMRGTNPIQRDDFVHQQMSDLMQQVMQQLQGLQNPNGQNQGPGAQGPGAQGPGAPGAGGQAPGGTCCAPGGAQGPGAGSQAPGAGGQVPGAGGQAPGTEGATPGTGAQRPGAAVCGPSQPESPAANPKPTPAPGGNPQTDNGAPPQNPGPQRPGNWDHRPYTPPGAGNGNRPTPMPGPWDGQRPSPMPRPSPINWAHEQAGGRGDSAGRGNAGADRITARESAALRLLAQMFARLQ